MIFILEYFLLGIFFCTVINPLLDGLVMMLLQGIEVINGFFKMVIAKQTLKITQMSENASSSSRGKIGFIYDDEGDNRE